MEKTYRPLFFSELLMLNLFFLRKVKNTLFFFPVEDYVLVLQPESLGILLGSSHWM